SVVERGYLRGSLRTGIRNHLAMRFHRQITEITYSDQRHRRECENCDPPRTKSYSSHRQAQRSVAQAVHRDRVSRKLQSGGLMRSNRRRLGREVFDQPATAIVGVERVAISTRVKSFLFR